MHPWSNVLLPTVALPAIACGSDARGSAEGDAVPALGSAPPGTSAASSAERATRQVIINGQRLPDAELSQAQQAYRIRIPDVEYWYDAVLGAWGAQGGPTLGFISAGLSLGGPLRQDASNVATRVAVNGRELPVADVLALKQITGPIQPCHHVNQRAGACRL